MCAGPRKIVDAAELRDVSAESLNVLDESENDVDPNTVHVTLTTLGLELRKHYEKEKTIPNLISELGIPGQSGGGYSTRRKSTKRKSTKRKSTRRKSTKRKSTRRKSTRRKSADKKKKTRRRRR